MDSFSSLFRPIVEALLDREFLAATQVRFFLELVQSQIILLRAAVVLEENHVFHSVHCLFHDAELFDLLASKQIKETKHIDS